MALHAHTHTYTFHCGVCYYQIGEAQILKANLMSDRIKTSKIIVSAALTSTFIVNFKKC